MDDDRVQELLRTWVPLVGACLSIVMGLIPMRDVLQCRRNKSLGQINPDVFPLLFINAVGWTIYAACTQDAYLFSSVFTNVIFGIFYVLTAYQLVESDAARRRIEVVMLTMLGLWSALGFAAPQIPDEALRNNLVGSTATITSLILFASPLSTMATVVRAKSAASISLPFALMQVLCCGLWSLYGFAIHDIFLAAPNCLAATLGILQLLLLLAFGSKVAQSLVLGLPLIPLIPLMPTASESLAYSQFVEEDIQPTFIALEINAEGRDATFIALDPPYVSMPDKPVEQVVSPPDEEIRGVDNV